MIEDWDFQILELEIVEAEVAVKGGEGSGYRGHAGRPGQRGGSAPSGSGSTIRSISQQSASEIEDWPTGVARDLAQFAIEDSPEAVGLYRSGKLVGVAGLSESAPGTTRNPFSEPYMEVDFLAAYQSGKGIGTDMMRKIMGIAKNRGLGIQLVADEGAISFYEKMGFKRAGESRAWFHLSKDDVINWNLPSSKKAEEYSGGDAEPEHGCFVDYRQLPNREGLIL